MGLRLFWELNKGKCFTFTKLQVLSLPISRFKHIPGITTPVQPPLSTGFESSAAANSQREELLFRRQFTRRVLDKNKRAFLAGASLLLDEKTEWAAEIFRKITRRDETQADAFFALILCSNNADEQLKAAEQTLLLRRTYTCLSKEAGVAFSAIFLGCDGRQIRVVNDSPGLELLAAEIFQNHGKLEDASRLLERSQYAELDIFRFSRGNLLLKLQCHEEAIDVLKRLKTDPLLAATALFDGDGAGKTRVSFYSSPSLSRLPKK